MTERSFIRSDRAGFPMIWVDNLGAYMHWLPVSKIQFEHFLCDAPDIYFGAEWYEQTLALNPRVTPRDIVSGNYWQGLMTGVQPGEAQRFAAWCGDGYRLPTAAEWARAYQELRLQPFRDLVAFGVFDGRESRIRELLKRTEAASAIALQRLGYKRRFSDQMLLRLGVLEWVWVEDRLPRWGMKGEPFPGFCGNLEVPGAADPASAFSPETARLACAGFRLLYFPQMDEARQPPAGETVAGVEKTANPEGVE